MTAPVFGRRRALLLFFSEEQDTWLTALRVGLAAQLAAYCLSLAGSWTTLLGRTGDGIIGREISEAFTATRSPLIPTMGWLLKGGAWLNTGEELILNAAWVVLLAAALALGAGFFTRTAAVTCWFLHLCAAKSGGLVAYGVDQFMTAGLFYLMLAPLPDRYALDSRLWPRSCPSSPLPGFVRRLLQVHLCIVYLFGGITKALGTGWWNGENLWRALTRPPFDILPPELLLRWEALLPLLGVSIWLLELSYPLFIWFQKTRLIWLVAICAMHFGIGFAMGMHLFAVVMIVLNVAAFWPFDSASTCSEIQLRHSSRGNARQAASGSTPENPLAKVFRKPRPCLTSQSLISNSRSRTSF